MIQSYKFRFKMCPAWKNPAYGTNIALLIRILMCIFYLLNFPINSVWARM